MSSISPAATSSLLGSLQSNTPTVSGLASGLDTDKIITSLLAIDQAQIRGLQNHQALITSKQAAYKQIEARLLTLQSDMTNLGRSQSGAFDLRTATSSDESLVKATASTSAVAGVYRLQVISLAQANQIASQGFADPSAKITHGTFQIRTTSGPTASVTIDSSNDTVQGLAAAINSGGAGVSATVINDGSGTGTQPFRLLLTSNLTGTANAISITNTLAADGGGSVKPVFDATYIGVAAPDASYSGTATPTANAGAGGYTGTTNNTYRFTVVTGGIVGTASGLQLSYTDSTGANTGSITLNAGDAGVAKAVAQGLQIQLGAGTLIAGQSFSVKAFVPTVQAATNATVALGSGSGALTVQSATNQLDNVIPGVTLNLQNADTTKSVSVTVANDTAKASQGIQDFVSAYNDLMKFIDVQVHYDSTTGTAGVLLGDSQVTTIQGQLRGIVGNRVANVNPLMNHLGALGITTDDQGQLVLNQSKLDSALNGGVSGVSLADVRNLFALAGQSSNPGVQFVTGSVLTKASATPIQVDVSQVAQQATITATSALADSTAIDATNNTFTLSVDSINSDTISLAPGTYTRQGLAQEIQGKINASSSLVGRQVTVGLQGNSLVLTSGTYGSASKVAIGTGTAVTALGFSGSESSQGQDVVGQFIVNGVAEAATGSGQFLVGNSTNANTAALQVRVTLSPSQVVNGPEASLTVTRGLASQVDVALNSWLDPVSGRLKSLDDSFTADKNDIQKEITRETTAMQAKHDALVAQFTAVEQAISQLQSIGSLLGSQLQALPLQNISQSSSQSSLR